MKTLLAGLDLALRAGPRRLLAGLSFTLRAGEFWALVGPNGSGKSTLLHTLAGLAAPAAGEVQLAQRPLAAWTEGEQACLRGIVPQVLHDAFSATALDTVLVGRHPHLDRWAWESDADRGIALAALEAVDMAGLAGHDVTSLSGGERQRVAIAALLAQDPLLMLLDEPVAHLDLRHQILVLGHLRRLADERGKGLMVAIHDLNLAQRFATHALVLGGDGALPVQGPVDTVLTEATLQAAFGHAVARATLGDRVVFIPR